MSPAASPARSRFLSSGDRLGKYELIRQLAVGGMAELYLARTMGIEGFEKLCVVKRILPQHAQDKSFVAMFLDEARLAATLHHPNIAQVYDIDQEDGDYFFSMEYVHGEDLGRLAATAAENGVPISLDAALTLVAGMCAGLHYAHEKASPDGRPLKVVHRDVSPSNILVSYDGAVKVVDFGIARSSRTVSAPGGLKGKIVYMSPEQCRGQPVIDRRSDVFSIGTILYELTTSQLPFHAETEYGVLEQIVNKDAPPPSSIVPGYPPALEAIVMRALARDPERRFASTLELQGQIEDFAHENRLRVSPLVLARLMSTLFPARLEEWAHARAQGAFFVEQHVVRTLIESGRGESAIPGDGDPPAPAPEPQEPHDDDTTGVRSVSEEGLAPGAPGELHHFAPAPPALALVPTPVPMTRPTPLPRASQPALVEPVVGIGAAQALGNGATATAIEPGQDPATSLIVPSLPSPPLVAESSPVGRRRSQHAVGDVTEMVRVAPPRRSNLIFVLLAIVGAIAGIAVSLLVVSRGGGTAAADETHPTKAPAKVETPRRAKLVDPPPAPPPPPTEATAPLHEDAHGPAPVELEIERPAEPKLAPVRRPYVPVRRPKPPAQTQPPKQDYNADSPFLPVRPEKK